MDSRLTNQQPHKQGIKKMSEIDKIIHKLFSTRWTKDLNKSPIEDMRKQLHKNMQNQIDVFWTGHTA